MNANTETDFHTPRHGRTRHKTRRARKRASRSNRPGLAPNTPDRLASLCEAGGGGVRGSDDDGTVIGLQPASKKRIGKIECHPAERCNQRLPTHKTYPERRTKATKSVQVCRRHALNEVIPLLPRTKQQAPVAVVVLAQNKGIDHK